jgi:hypothetical protein
MGPLFVSFTVPETVFYLVNTSSDGIEPQTWIP